MLSAETFGATYGLVKKTMQGAGAIKGDKGDKGDRGEKGEKGDKGDLGNDGDKGDRGYTGAKGEDGVTPSFSIGSVQSGESADATVTGTDANPVLNLVLPKGEKGEKGETGRDGKDGQNGSSFSIRSRFATEDDLRTAFPTGPDNEGDAYFVGTGVSPDLYVWLTDSEEWHNNGPIAGVKGDKGDTGDTGADGFSPVAQVTKADGVTTISIRDKAGVTTENILDGEKGADGKSAYEVAVDEGFLGSESEWLAELKGEQGEQGNKGDTGDKGFSPTATVTQLSDGAKIEITDENGKTEATVKNVSGELVYGASTVRTGSYTGTAQIDPDGSTVQDITFADPMPDGDYLVNLDSMSHDMIFTVQGKTKNGFTVVGYNEHGSPQIMRFNYTAFKLFTVTGYDALAKKVNDTIPNTASASNQLVTENNIYKTQFIHRQNAYSSINAIKGLSTGTDGYRTRVFALTSRAGETYIITCGQGDAEGRTVNIVCLFAVYKKLTNIKYDAANDTLYFSQEAYSSTEITQLAGGVANLTFTEGATVSNSATNLDVKQVAYT